MTDLLSPLVLRPGVVSPNRVWLAPLTNLQSHPDGTCSVEEQRFLGMRGDGGFGLVETCAAHVSQEGKAWPGELGVHDDAMIPGLTRLAARIHEGGALASVQRFLGGLRADPSVSGLPTLSASAYEEAGNATPRAATEDDLARVIGDFARAAKRGADAGFDGVELHGAHGYLLSQFQSTVYNQRTDRWGGSLESRARLIREVTRAVKEAAPSLVLAIRLSPEDFGQAKGIDLDETITLARWLAEDGMEVLHLSLWRSAQGTKKRPETHATPLFREAVGDRVRIVSAGGIWTREDAEAQLRHGADAVALGRAAIANADWPARIADGREIARMPLTAEHLLTQGLSPGFVEYMRKWKGFVA
ncbi:MAG: NADH:flavin oxidoreductase [Sandaracinaceae bacterium]|nr:NADH:flavin oxidoreductase [Sandaracinaceae bacterium]